MRTNETAGSFAQEDRRTIEDFKRALYVIAYAVMSALMSLVSLPGGYSPFGAAFIAAVPRKYLVASTVGGIIGSLFGGGALTTVEGLRHIATIIATAGIRWALGELKQVNAARFFSMGVAFAGVLLTGMVINGSTGSVISYSTLFFVIEGAISGIAAMFFAGAADALDYRDSSVKFSRQTSISIIITICAAMIPICRLEILGISPGLILLQAAVLSILPEKREVGGAVGGIAAGCVAALSRYDITQGAIYPIAALLAGYTAQYGRIFSAAVYVAVSFIGSTVRGTFDYILLAETVLAGTIYCLIPQVFVEKVLAAAGFAEESKQAQKSVDNTAAVKKLESAASALTGVSSVVEQVSDKLDKINAPEIDGVYRRSAEKVCEECACFDSCTEKGARTVCGKLKKLTPVLKNSGLVSGADISAALGRKCIHESDLAGEVNSQYGYHVASQSARRRIAQVRAVVSDQLEGVGLMLTELSEEIGAMGLNDEYSAELVANSLTSCGYIVDSALCTTSKNGRISLSLGLRTTDHTDLESYEIGEYVGEIFGCEFDEPRLERNDNSLTLRLVQRQNYMLSFGSAQHCCSGESLCGDAYDAFVDGEGNAYMLISDGMGSGGRAAVDGAMACGLLSQLLRGGFSYDCAMKLVNSALLVKSEDESLSTIDSLRLNLYSGRAMFCKAGAAQSYHVRDGVVNRIDIESLPLGILRETDTAQYSFTAEDGDIIVMMSDGVPTDDSMWFERLLKNYNGESARDFAKLLLDRAVGRRPEGEDDDITVVVGRIIAI